MAQNIQSVTELIAMYGSELWGSLVQHDRAKWEKNPIETLHAEFCQVSSRYKEKPQTLHAGLNQANVLYFY